jgi:hypothetical protein
LRKAVAESVLFVYDKWEHTSMTILPGNRMEPGSFPVLERSKTMTLTLNAVSQAAHALKRSSHPALRNLAVEGTTETLIVSGQVTSYYLKQLAQETIMPVRGVLELVNRVNVVGKS